jgi:dephospho-CoA kinase
MQPVLIGVTGGIGSGKSTASAELARLGAEVVVGDELGKSVVETSPEVLASIRSRFGDEVFERDGKLYRGLLANRVFQSPAHVKWLTDLTFPGIHALWRDAVRRSKHEVVVFDAALIFEWKIENEFDFVVVVMANANSVIERASRGKRFSREDVTARLASQVDHLARASRDHVVIRNDSTVDALRIQVQEFWNLKVIPLLQQRRNHIDRPI